MNLIGRIVKWLLYLALLLALVAGVGLFAMRFADGPDEVHHMVVGRAEVQKYGLWGGE